MAILVVVYGFALLLCICFALVKWNEIRYRKKGLPPGTMGWPIVGETAKFLKQGPSFMKNQKARYGNIFKSHILGCPTIISMDPELNRYILTNEAKGLVPGYPQSMVEILGKNNIGAVHGQDHKRLRGSMLSVIGPAALKDGIVPQIGTLMSRLLNGLDGKTIDLQEKTNEVAFFTAFYHILKTELTAYGDAFKREFTKMLLGTLSLPIRLAGTNYSRAFQGRKNAIAMLRKIMNERRASSTSHDDMLGCILKTDDPRHNYLSDEEIIDQIITILYSGYETVSTTTMMAVKYLNDYPKALQQIRDEHLTIREGKKPDDQITWNDYKLMRFTRAVICETSRLATVVNGLMRKTTNDMELNGYVIPKGWKLYVYLRELNYDPFVYPEPFTFNPWRWLDKNMESHKHCLFFGGGARLCPGKELGIVTVSLFLHYFVTSYRWEEIAGNKILKFPRVQAPNGLHIKVDKY